MRSVSGSAWAPGSSRTCPLTVTRPAASSDSAARRDAIPAWARILLRRIGGSGDLLLIRPGIGELRGGGLRELEHDQLALDLGQVAEIAQAEGDQELPGGLVEEGATGRFLAARDADHAALEQVVEHRLRVHPAHRVHLGARDGLPVADDGQRLQRGTGEAGAGAAAREL